MALYRVHFKWKDKQLALKARILDMSHPYFVALKDLLLEPEQKVIIDPDQDFLRSRFEQTVNVMLPVQSVQLVEELEDEISPLPLQKI